MTPKLSKIVTDPTYHNLPRKTDNALDRSSARDESEALALLTPSSPSPWRSKIPNSKLNAIRRHFALFDRSKLNEVNDDIENSWNCGICSETAVDPCVTRCGHMYCHAHLSNWLSTRPSCPTCESPCTPSEDLVRFFEREQPSPLLTPFAELSAQPSRSSTGSPFYDETKSTTSNELETSPNKPDSSRAAQPKSSSSIKPFLFDFYAHYAGLVLRVLGLAILLAALLPGGFFSSSSQE